MTFEEWRDRWDWPPKADLRAPFNWRADVIGNLGWPAVNGWPRRDEPDLEIDDQEDDTQ